MLSSSAPAWVLLISSYYTIISILYFDDFEDSRCMNSGCCRGACSVPNPAVTGLLGETWIRFECRSKRRSSARQISELLHPLQRSTSFACIATLTCITIIDFRSARSISHPLHPLRSSNTCQKPAELGHFQLIHSLMMTETT